MTTNRFRSPKNVPAQRGAAQLEMHVKPPTIEVNVPKISVPPIDISELVAAVKPVTEALEAVQEQQKALLSAIAQLTGKPAARKMPTEFHVAVERENGEQVDMLISTK